ncbi:NAD-P-binding protein [Rhexocercosporidium sp. MPI-PUGE-AT-0058]|nr:NAD-P-binding protein [Rhexocercosporidium sp. MPI-PUGE-AT-0058]
MWFLFGNSTLSFPDLTGKVALVTGANTGMGYIMAVQLAIHGAKVRMGARSEEKAKQAIEKFNTEHRNHTNKGTILWLPLDLISPTDVMASAKSFLSQVDCLDILVNNAASLASAYALTIDGLETSIATNHVAHFTLTEAILPLLRQIAQLPNSDVRVITVSSTLHTYVTDVKFETKADFNNTFGDGDDWDTVFVSSSLELGSEERIQKFSEVVPLLNMFAKTPLQGARAALVAATALEVRAKEEKHKGAYLGPGGRLALASETGRDDKLAKQLWDLTEKVVKDIPGIKGSK